MARYLAYTSPARGHLYPLMPTLLELRARGHEVHIRTLASEVAALRGMRLHAEPIAAAIEGLQLEDWRGDTPEVALDWALRTISERAPHEIADLGAAIESVAPDLLLVDYATVGAAALAETGSIPWAQWLPFFQHVSPFAPPPGLAAVNAVRRLVDADPLDGVEALWQTAPLVLYFTAAPFEHLGPDLPAALRLVGPEIWEPPADLPAWLADLPDPLTLVSVSSEFQHDDRLVQTALDAFADEPGSVVVTTAAHDPSGFRVPANARVERWLPHLPLMRRTTCVVCHGGMGVTQKALATGVPLCVVPFGRDQFEVAARVVEAEAGTRVDPGDLSPETLRAEVIAARTMTEGAQRVSAAFARAGGSTSAADALESLTIHTGV